MVTLTIRIDPQLTIRIDPQLTKLQVKDNNLSREENLDYSGQVLGLLKKGSVCLRDFHTAD